MFKLICTKKYVALTTKGFMEADNLANNAGNIAKPVNYTITTLKQFTDNNRSGTPADSVLRKICVKNYIRCTKKYFFRCRNKAVNLVSFLESCVYDARI